MKDRRENRENEESDITKRAEPRAGGAPADPSGAAAAARPPEEKHVGIESRLAASEEERERLKDKYLRALAELDNYRKRAARERDDVAARARADTLAPLLEVLDDLERALSETGIDGGPLATGIALIRDKMLALLRGLGVTPIDTAGALFDPTLHESFGGLTTADSEPHAILQELRRGYFLDGRVLRPARVLIALPAEGESSQADAE